MSDQICLRGAGRVVFGSDKGQVLWSFADLDGDDMAEALKNANGDESQHDHEVLRAAAKDLVLLCGAQLTDDEAVARLLAVRRARDLER